MRATGEILCLTLAAASIEVITFRAADGLIVTVINGGRLDNEVFTGAGDPADQHARAVKLARIAAQSLRRTFRAVA